MSSALWAWYSVQAMCLAGKGIARMTVYSQGPPPLAAWHLES
jgi:hypothetical protein